MTPERFRQIDKLLDLALEKKPSERKHFLDEACNGDEALRQKLESLLLSHEQARVFLTQPPTDLATDILASCEGQVSADQSKTDWPGEPNKVLGRYVITERLGGGGMGVVYVAYDPELKRKLAIKLMLPASDLASPNTGRARLLREAEAMARLSHPNVIPIYDVGTLGDQVFIAMEYVEGTTLANWLSRTKRPWREIVSVFVQAGAGLAAAHAAGIVHRDFKPDNVLVGTDGRVRVLDFGLARAAHGDRADTLHGGDSLRAPTSLAAVGTLGVPLTETGKLMGTPAYMAPEQLLGQPGDARSDQFAFCVALYQGLYGKLPFSAETVTTLLDQMHQKGVKQVAQSIGVPARVGRVVLRGLSPAPEDRYGSMDSLLRELTRHPPARLRWSLAGLVILLAVFALGRLARERPNPQQFRSIAVLPLENLSHDPQQEYLADGFTDELITNLSKVGSLRVIARSSAMRYKARPRSLRQIAKELSVDAMLEGTVLLWGNRVRITTQLIDARTEQTLWAESYDELLGDIFSLQNRIARAVIAGAKLKLTAPDEERLSRPQPVTSEAYQAYLRGLYYWQQEFTPSEDNDAAIRAFEQATALSPSFALGYAYLAFAYASKYAFNATEELATKAVGAAETSLSLDPNLPEAYTARARVATIQRRSLESEVPDLRRALALNPNLAQAHFYLGTVYLSLGLLDQAQSELNAVLAHDPYFVIARFYQARLHIYQQRYDEALRDFEWSLGFGPQLLWEKALALFYQGQRRAAHQLISELRQKLPGDPNVASTYAILLAAESEKEQSREQIHVALRSGERRHNLRFAEYNIASAYALMGDHRQALQWLRRTAEDRFPCYPLFERDPNLDNLRGDPDFEKWLSEMKAQWERRRASL